MKPEMFPQTLPEENKDGLGPSVLRTKQELD